MIKLSIFKGLALPLRLEGNGAISAHCSLCFLSSGNRLTSVSQVARTTGTCHHTQLLFLYFVEIGFCHGVQPCLELLNSCDPPSLASQSAGITSTYVIFMHGLFIL
uniref:Uncharacterized protein n=1 Tax=Papio anubis TaxID=9555 RepID=A0A8I5R1A2_PAPAN